MSRARLARSCWILLVVVVAATSASRAWTGRVADVDGKPIAGARACLVQADAEELCVDADAQGHYELPSSAVSGIRITAWGFLPKVIAAADRDAPVVLERAAILRARLVDADTGKAIAKGDLRIAYASGTTKGPFPTNAAGVRVNALPPGEAVPMARAPRYREEKGPIVRLEAGHETEIVLRLHAETPPSEPGTGGR